MSDKERKGKLQPVNVTRGLLYNNEGRILLLQRPQDKTDPGIWELPGGKQDIFSPKDNIIKEIKEETGLEVKAEIHIGSYKGIDLKTRKLYRVRIYACKVISGRFVLSDEHIDFQWVKPNDVVSFNMRPQEREVVLQSLED